MLQAGASHTFAQSFSAAAPTHLAHFPSPVLLTLWKQLTGPMTEVSKAASQSAWDSSNASQPPSGSDSVRDGAP